MAEQFQERRRTPRVAVSRGKEMQIGRRVRVKVVDISANGALLWTDEQLSVGREGRLNVRVDGNPVEAQVQIRREGSSGTGPGSLVGAALTSVQPGHQRVLDEFLRRAGADPTMD